MEVVDLVLLEGNPVAALAGAIGLGGKGIGAERVAAEAGDGALRDDVVVVGAGDDGAGGEELVLAVNALEKRELEPVHGVLDGDRWLLVLRHWRRSSVVY